MENNSLANKIINGGVNNYSEFGIDELGLPVPNPVNVDYVVARIIARNDNIFRIGEELFVNRRHKKNNRGTLMVLCGEPKIILWSDNANRGKWKGVMPVMGGRCPLVWDRLLSIVPEYNRDAIEIVDGIIWNKKKADIEYPNNIEGGKI